MKTSTYPKLSIITINLNDKAGLRKTIESVLMQTFREFEFIIIDGNSEDGSIDVIHEYQNRISYWVSETDTGIYHAMNKGIKIANGEYLLFLNSGDWLFDDTVLKSSFEKINPASAVCTADMYLDDGKTLKLYSDPLNVSFSFFKSAHLAHQSSFIKRIMFEKYGLYNEANKIASDWEFFFFILVIKAEKYQKLAGVLTVFNLSGISNDKSMQKINEIERQQAIDKYISKSLQVELLELEVLRQEFSAYKSLKKRNEERRFRLLAQIEKSTFLRILLTIQMIILAKLVGIFTKNREA